MGYDADWVRGELLVRGVLPVTPANPARTEPAPLDRELYRLRNRVERLVGRLKQFRAVATRYDKTAESFLAFVHLAAGTRCVLGDMGYDADWVRQELLLRGVLPVIPPNPVRKEPVPLDLVVRRRQLVRSLWLGEPHSHRRGRLARGYLLSAPDH